MTVMYTMTSSYVIHTIHAKKTEIPKGFSRGRCRPSMAGSESLSFTDNLPNIARVEPVPPSRIRGSQSRTSKSAVRRILSAPADSKVCFGMPENPAPETSAPSAGDGMGSTPKSSNLKIKNAMAKKIKGRPRSADPCKYHYNFKLNEAQNKRFLDMLEQSGCTDNKSRFILSRLFG